MKIFKQLTTIFLQLFLIANFLVAMENGDKPDPSLCSPGVGFVEVFPYPLPERIILAVLLDDMFPEKNNQAYVLSPLSSVLKRFWNIANSSKGMRAVIFNKTLIKSIFLKFDLLAKERAWRKDFDTIPPFEGAFYYNSAGPDKLMTYDRCLLVEALTQLQRISAILRVGLDFSDDGKERLVSFLKELVNMSTLHLAMENGHPSVLYLATYVGTLEEVEFLIKCGANPDGVPAGISDLDCPDDGRRYRPLCAAFDRERYDIAEVLYRAGANLNAIGWDTSSFHGKLLVEYAQCWKHKEMEQWLLDRGANPKAEKGRMSIGDW